MAVRRNSSKPKRVTIVLDEHHGFPHVTKTGRRALERSYSVPRWARRLACRRAGVAA